MPESAKMSQTEAVLLAHVDLLIVEVDNLIAQMKMKNLIDLHNLGIASADVVNDELGKMLRRTNG